MDSIATDALPVFALFSPAFTPATFSHAQLLAVAAILTTGRRTVSNLLRTLGHLAAGAPSSYHRVLSETHWSGLRLAALLTRFLLRRYWPSGIVTLVGDDTVSAHCRPRKKGAKLPAPQAVVMQSPHCRYNVAWYGGGRRDVEVVSGCGHWYKGGVGLVEVRWVYVHEQLPAEAQAEVGVEWEGKIAVTFSDAITAVRRWLWTRWAFEKGGHDDPFTKLPEPLRRTLLYALAPALP